MRQATCLKDEVLNFNNTMTRVERHHNNLSSVNYLMTTVKIERPFIHLR